MQELRTTSEIIEELGGNIPVGALTGSKPKAVSNWRGHGKFPWHTQMPIIEALRARGKTAPASLWGMSKRRAAA